MEGQVWGHPHQRSEVEILRKKPLLNDPQPNPEPIAFPAPSERLLSLGARCALPMSCHDPNRFQYPSETTSTTPSTTLMAV
jgi:hypothetical protein